MDAEKMLNAISNMLECCKDLNTTEFATVIPMVFDYFTAEKGMSSKETIKLFEGILDAMRSAHKELGAAVIMEV